jgi:hypothetical protein
MPATFLCDNCDVSAPSLTGWFTVAIGYFSEGPDAPPPGSRAFDGAAPTLIFHSTDCRDAWCEKAGVSPPPTP